MKAITFNYVTSRYVLERGQSLDGQKEITTDYANRNKFNIQKNYMLFSGDRKQHDKAIDSMIEEIRASQEPIALVISSVDCIQRNINLSFILDDLRKQGKVELHLVRENLVLRKDSPSSDIQWWDIGIMFARNYALQISGSIKRARQLKKHQSTNFSKEC